MKRCLVLCIAAILLLVGLCGCKEQGVTMEELSQVGTLKIALIGECAPYVIQNEDGSLWGIEVDLLHRVCEQINVKAEFTLLDRETALNGVEKGDYHLAAGMLSDKSETEQTLVYTNGYAKIPQAVVCKLDGEFHNMTDLRVKRIGTRIGTYAHALSAREGYFGFGYNTFSESLQQLEQDKVVALLMDRWVAQQLVTPYDEETAQAGDLVILDGTVATGLHCFAMAGGSGDVVNQINIAISQLAAEGIIAEIFETYFATYYSPYQ
ncbi:MAG: amino acid ABC transporter substrate-binding protein [Clostridia bacterium]|nr:amino acid ABC transporter substrate-binding protein [Clostridia bacterium]